jgi:hypothetical protein
LRRGDQGWSGAHDVVGPSGPHLGFRSFGARPAERMQRSVAAVPSSCGPASGNVSTCSLRAIRNWRARPTVVGTHSRGHLDKFSTVFLIACPARISARAAACCRKRRSFRPRHTEISACAQRTVATVGWRFRDRCIGGPAEQGLEFGEDLFDRVPQRAASGLSLLRRPTSGARLLALLGSHPGRPAGPVPGVGGALAP